MAFKIGMATVGDLVNLCPLSAWELTLAFVYWGWRISNANPPRLHACGHALFPCVQQESLCVVHAVALLRVI